MKINPNTSALILIDLQGRLMPAIHQAESILKECICISKVAKILNIPIIGTEQSPISLGNNLEEISQFCDKTITKDHFDGCIDGLLEYIPKNCKQLIIAGCEAHVCVLQTSLHLLKEGFEVFMLVDAVGSRSALDKEIGLKRLENLGAHLITTEMAAFEWLGAATNPKFKEILALIK